MSNCTFLKTDWSELYDTAREAEQNVNSAPRLGFDSAQPSKSTRRSLERAVKWLYANGSYLKQPYAGNLAALIHEPTFRENLELIHPDISIAKRYNAIYSTHNAY